MASGVKKLSLSDVAKQDLDVVVYLLVYGIVAYLSKKYLVDNDLSLVFGGLADYLLYRVKTELKNEGYKEALK